MKIVTRKEWGAKPPTGPLTPARWSKSVDLWVHHTAGPESQTPAQIQAFHQGPSRGWNDIGYHYLVNYAGTVYEGRGREVYGAHSPGKNGEPSIALIGDYSKKRPSEAQKRAVYELRDYLGVNRIRGHRDNTATSCPGDAAYAYIVKGPPPARPVPPKLTLRQRLVNGFRKAGFGGKSAQQAADKYIKETK